MKTYYNETTKRDDLVTKCYCRKTANALIREAEGSWRMPRLAELKEMYKDKAKYGVESNRVYWVSQVDTWKRVYFDSDGVLYMKSKKRNAKRCMAFVLPMFFKRKGLERKTAECGYGNCKQCGVRFKKNNGKHKFCSLSCGSMKPNSQLLFDHAAMSNKRGRPRKEEKIETMQAIEIGSSIPRAVEPTKPKESELDKKLEALEKVLVDTQAKNDKNNKDELDELKLLTRGAVGRLMELENTLRGESTRLEGAHGRLDNFGREIILMRNDIKKMDDSIVHNQSDIRDVRALYESVLANESKIDYLSEQLKINSSHIMDLQISSVFKEPKKERWFKMSIQPSFGISAGVTDGKLIILLPFFGMSFGRAKQE